MLILVFNLIASALLIYIMLRYALLMLYLQMLYLYTMPLVMLALTSLLLLIRQSLILSLKAKIQLAICQNSLIAPTKDPNLIIKQYIKFLQVEYY
jgi:hypothetical protein